MNLYVLQGGQYETSTKMDALMVKDTFHTFAKVMKEGGDYIEGTYMLYPCNIRNIELLPLLFIQPLYIVAISSPFSLVSAFSQKNKT